MPCRWLVCSFLSVLAFQAPSAAAEKASLSYIDPNPCCLAADGRGIVFAVGPQWKDVRPDGTMVSRLDSMGAVLSTFRFRVGDFDQPRAAAVDPQGNLWVVGGTGFPSQRGLIVQLDRNGTSILYSAVFGGAGTAGSTVLNAIVFDETGNAYVGGATTESDFPLTAGGYTGKFGGPHDTTSGWQFLGPTQYGFVSKLALNRGGYSLVYSAMLGGEKLLTSPCPTPGGCYGIPPASAVSALAVASDGVVTAAGVTDAPDFPVSDGAFQTQCRCDHAATVAFVTRLKADGGSLAWSTFLGAGAVTSGLPMRVGGIALDSDANVILTGTTPSPEFPVVAPVLQSFARLGTAPNNGFVSRLDSTGSRLLFSTYYGGAVVDAISAPRLDSRGNIWLSEQISSRAGVPLREGSLSLGNPAASPLIAELAADGSAVLFSELLPNGAAGRDLVLTPDDALIAAGGRYVVRQSRQGISGVSILGVADMAFNGVTTTVAPGEVVSIYGTGLGPGLTEVRFDDTAAKVIYASENQVNVVVPGGLSPGLKVRMKVVTPFGVSQDVPLEVVGAQPNVVTVLDLDGAAIDSANLAMPGSEVAIVLSGAGSRAPDVLVDFGYTVFVPRGISPMVATVTPSSIERDPYVEELLRIKVTVPRIVGILSGFGVTIRVKDTRSPGFPVPTLLVSQ